MHRAPGKEPLISEKAKQTGMVKANVITGSAKSKRGKRKWILWPQKKTLLTLLTTSSLLFFVTASILNVRVHVTSELFKAFLSQPIMVY